MRHNLSALLLAAVSLAIPIAAHAKTITFDLTNFTFDSGATASGTINIDVTTGQLLSANITYIGTSTYVFKGAFQDQGVFGGNQYYGDLFTLPDGNGFDFDIDIPLTSLVGYTGGVICTSASQCSGGFAGGLTPYPNTNNYDYSATGTLTASPVPEPSSVLLFGTGLLGVVGSIRRRLNS
jgi:hypothetical protein